MGLQSKKKLKVIVGTLKDKASLLSSAASPCPASAAVLRATTHHPSSEPSPRRHLDALLAFGRGPRPTAASAVATILSRLRGTGDAAVALKSLALLHHVARHGSFILRDQLLSALLQPPSGGAPNPLNLSAFRDGASAETWALTWWVRWYARVLEQLFSCYRATGVFLNGDHRHEAEEEERVASLPNADLLEEMDALAGLIEEGQRKPGAAGCGLVEEVARWVGEDSAAAEKAAMARVREMGERVGCLGFGESVELTCLLRRLQGVAARGDCRVRSDLVAEVKQKTEMAEREEEQRRRGGTGATE